MQYLERDLPVKDLIERSVDCSHTTSAERVAHEVAPETAAVG
jgi:hypothetical protein